MNTDQGPCLICVHRSWSAAETLCWLNRISEIAVAEVCLLQ